MTSELNCTLNNAELADRLYVLADAVTKRDWSEFTMRVPVDLNRDADMVLLEAAQRLGNTTTPVENEQSKPTEFNECVRLPKITEDIREGWRGDIKLIDEDKQGRMDWTQDAVDFACLLQAAPCSLRQPKRDKLLLKADRGQRVGGENTPIATVINNNQPGWTNIIETAPNVTLDVGTKLYAAPQNPRVNTSIDVKDPDVNEDVDGELARLEREIAIDYLKNVIDSSSSEKDGHWYCKASTDLLVHEVRYLELRGLLERHPTDPNLLRLKTEKEK